MTDAILETETETTDRKVVIPTILPCKAIRTATVGDTKQFRAVLDGELRTVLIANDEAEDGNKWHAVYEAAPDETIVSGYETRRELFASLSELVDADKVGLQVVADQADIANALDGKHSINVTRLLAMYAEHPGLQDDGETRMVQASIDGHIAWWAKQDAKAAASADADAPAPADAPASDEEE